MRKNPVSALITAIVLLFLYVPIIVLVVNSFNASRFGTIWGGFSFKWYSALFRDRNVWVSLSNTVVVALVSTAVSVVLGSLAGFSLYRYKGRFQRMHYGLVSLPLIFPDILMGMSLLLFFIALGIRLSLLTIILGHITFSISYVAVTIMARLQNFDFSVVEAAEDLGASRFTIITRIYIPLLGPGLAAGAMLALTLSLDDFVITFFTAGPGSSTLPLQIYSMIKFGKPPMINALSTLFLSVTFIVALFYQRIKEKI